MSQYGTPSVGVFAMKKSAVAAATSRKRSRVRALSAMPSNAFSGSAATNSSCSAYPQRIQASPRVQVVNGE